MKTPVTPPIQHPSTTPTQSVPVYTMPAKYIPPRKVSVARPWLPWVIAGVAIVGLLIVAVVATALYMSSRNTGVVQDNQNQNTNVQVTNANSNRNDARNRNVNSGVTLNVNLDPQLNSNIQNGLFNGNTNTVQANTNVATGFVPGMSTVRDARDKDRDGLTDVEEELYATKFQLPDSDKDGYVDGTEIRGLFSPTEANKTVLQSGLALQYTNPTYGWGIVYPKKWVAAPLAQSPAEVVFTPDSEEGEFIEVIVTENTNRQSAAAWYATQFPQVKATDLKAVTIGGLQGIVGQDGYVYYLANSQYIFTLVYQFGTKTEVHYSTTFEMMIKSFTYTPPASTSTNTNQTTTNANSNTNASS